jgi:hypothetical protein
VKNFLNVSAAMTDSCAAEKWRKVGGSSVGGGSVLSDPCLFVWVVCVRKVGKMNMKGFPVYMLQKLIGRTQLPKTCSLEEIKITINK